MKKTALNKPKQFPPYGNRTFVYRNVCSRYDHICR